MTMKLNPKALQKTKVQLDKPVKQEIKVFSFDGQELIPEGYLPEILVFVKKFGSRYGVRLQYLEKFAAFKLFKNIKGKQKHVDWITLNDLMKIYDCRLPNIKPRVNAQRPFKNERVY